MGETVSNPTNQSTPTINQSTPKKLTLTLVLRWIFGSLFLLAFFGALIEGNFLASVFILLAALILIPPIAQAIESKLNYSLSGVLRFVIVIGLLAGFGAAMPHTTPDTSANNVNDIPASTVNTPNHDEPTTQNKQTTQNTNTNVCYWDWKYGTTSNIGDYYKAPSGSTYAVVTLYIKNNADSSISTNPFNWDLIADGIKYTPDAATFDSSIHSQSVDVRKGGEIETEIVYVVKGSPTTANLEYNGFGQPDMQMIKYY